VNSGATISSPGCLRFKDLSLARRALRSSAAAPRVEEKKVEEEDEDDDMFGGGGLFGDD